MSDAQLKKEAAEQLAAGVKRERERRSVVFICLECNGTGIARGAITRACPVCHGRCTHGSYLELS